MLGQESGNLGLFKNNPLFLRCVFVLPPGVECRNEFTSLLAVVNNEMFMPL